MSYPGLLDLFKYETLSTQKKYELFIEYLDGRKDTYYFDDIEEEGLRLEHLDVLLTHADDFNEEFLLNRLQQLSTTLKNTKSKSTLNFTEDQFKMRVFYYYLKFYRRKNYENFLYGNVDTIFNSIRGGNNWLRS